MGKQHLVVENGRHNQEEASDSDNDDDGFEDEESPKSKRGRPKKAISTSSPEESVKKKRGRPKKVITENLGNRKRMNEEDISAALEESYHEKPKRNRKAVKYDSGDEEEDEESESEKEDSESESEEPDSDQQPEKKRKVQIPEESTRRSGRERKVPKKFEVIIPEKKKRKKKIITSDFSENDDSESDYGSKKRK